MKGLTDKQYEIIKKVRKEHNEYHSSTFRDIQFFEIIALNMIADINDRKSWPAISKNLNVTKASIQTAQKNLTKAGLLDLPCLANSGVNFVNKKQLRVFKPASLFDVSAIRG
jgi:hypothetical protein